MAEFILAVVSLGLAAPGIVVSFQQCGKYLADRIQAFKNAPTVLADLRAIVTDIYQGQLIVEIKIAAEAFATDEYDDSLKKSLDHKIKALASQIFEASKFVEGISIDSTWQRLWFSATLEKRARHINKELKRSQNDLQRTLSILHAQRDIAPDSLLLRENRLMVTGNVSALSEDSQTLFTGKCEYKESITVDEIQYFDVLFERVDGPDVTEDQVRTVTAHLTRQFNPKSRDQYCGILPCLGYRMSPQAELCFRLPQERFQINSLHSIINRDVSRSGIFQRNLEDRFVFARAVAEAVLAVASIGFVHKSIRSGTIFLLQPEGPNQDKVLGKPFLTMWQFLRKASTLSKRTNPRDDWQENVYRHPQRHGIQVQMRYNIGHDIYSLGVCLLEVGLWSTLWTDVNGTPQPAESFKNAAADFYDIPVSQLDLQSKFRYPVEIQAILVTMAEKELPGRMGSAYAQLVRQCLQCLDGAFGDDVDFYSMSHVQASVFFNDMVLASFPSLASN